MSGKLIRMFHASPRSLYERIQPHASREERISMFENSDLTENIEGERKPDVVCYGDVHQAFVQNFRGKTLCNAGSVGNPLEITQASYLIFEGTYNEKKLSFSIQLVRVPYDIELAIRLAEELEMPEIEEYKQELRTALYRGFKGSKLIIYQRFFKYIYHNLKYINDFFDISTIRQRISIYRQIVT